MDIKSNKSNIFIIFVIFLALVTQFLPINRASAIATVTNGQYFFSNASNSGPNSCAAAGKNCDALLQYGVESCVYKAANAGDFFGNGFNGGFSVSIKEL